VVLLTFIINYLYNIYIYLYTCARRDDMRTYTTTHCDGSSRVFSLILSVIIIQHNRVLGNNIRARYRISVRPLVFDLPDTVISCTEFGDFYRRPSPQHDFLPPSGRAPDRVTRGRADSRRRGRTQYRDVITIIAKLPPKCTPILW